MDSEDAVLIQIKYWYRTIQQLQKGIRRKNKYIARLERENNNLLRHESHLMMTLMKLKDKANAKV